MYSLDNLAQGQIDRSPRNAGKGHINLPSEGAGVAPREAKRSRQWRLNPQPLSAVLRGQAAAETCLLRSIQSQLSRIP